MGTRSTISKVYPDGTVKSIYCHWDGYVSNNGVILQEHYQDETKIDQLLALGSISSLGRDIGTKHSFESPEPGYTVAYHRDRGEGLTVTATASYLEWLRDTDHHEEYNYVRKGGEWFVFEDPQFVTPLRDAIEADPSVPDEVKEKFKQVPAKKPVKVPTKVKKKRKPRSVVLIGRQWFRKTAGNSYQTVQIIVDGKIVHKTDRSGGYGGQYAHDGLVWLDSSGYIKRLPNESAWQFEDRTGIEICCVLIHVASEKEL